MGKGGKRVTQRDKLRAKKDSNKQRQEKWLQRQGTDPCRNSRCSRGRYKPRQRKGYTILVGNVTTWIPKGVQYTSPIALPNFTSRTING